ncbi:MAB_1171c family putative transporter [Streptosporangium sandarakinum]|uniref:MAB_1171c family putative transporter n=1 Tax=Streptosporangium sandarakinum TaxID=1260955 RepID=UPI0037B7B92D
MSESLHLVIMASLWTVVLWRAPALRDPGPIRILWLTLLCIAVAWSMSSPTLLRPIFDHLDTWAGWPVISVIKRFIAVAGAASLTAFALRLTGRAIGAVLVGAGMVITVMAVTYLLAGRDARGIAEWDGSTAQRLYFLAYEGWLLAAAVISGITAVRHAWTAVDDPADVRAGLAIFGVGLLGWVPTSSTIVWGLLVAGPGAYTEDANRIPMAATILAVLIGSSIPAIGMVVRWRRTRTLLTTLAPLHSTLAEAFPEQVMTLDSADPETALVRSYVEICDGLVVLAGSMHQPIPADPAEAAEWIRTALQSRTTGEHGYGPVSGAPSSGRTALASEMAATGVISEMQWVAAVSQAYSASEAPSRAYRAAQVMSTTTSPKVVGLVLPVVAGALTDGGVGLEWGLAAALLCAGLPIAAFHGAGGSMAKGGRGRLTPLLLAAVTLVFGLAALLATDAPTDVVEVMVALLAMLATLAPITAAWDISWHTATLSVGVAWSITHIGSVAAAGILLIVASAWSRVLLGEHTVAQTIAGAAAGATTAAAVLALIS